MGGAAPVGALVCIYFDGVAVLGQGDALVTPTGRTYVVVTNRIQRRGAHVGRQHLACVVALEPGADRRVVRMRWYRRERRSDRWRAARGATAK